MNETEQNTNPTPVLPTKQQMTPTKWLIVAAVVLVLFTGLRSLFSPERMIERAIERETGGRVDIDTDGGGTMTFEGDNGEQFSVTAGEQASLPDNWPSEVAIMDDATITYAGSMMGASGGGLTTVFTSRAAKAEVVDFYRRTLADAGYTIAEVMDFGDSAMVTATRGESDSVGVTVASEGDETTVTITVGIK